MSKGCEELLAIVRTIFPNQRIVLEHNLAETGALFLDIYLPQLSVAFEFDGIQHFTYSEHFHGSLDAFRASKKRDAQKTARCQELGISLVRVRYDEAMNKELVLGKLEQALDKENNG
jgi:very-short-patch-repair endonuclease